MGDRTYTSIQFSGDISEEQAAELLDLLDNQCGDDGSGIPLVQGHAECKFTLEHLRAPHNSFSDDECNYAQMDAIECWCHDNRVTYLKNWQAGGGFDPGLELYDHATDVKHSCATVDSTAAVTVDELLKNQENDTLDELVRHLVRFENFSTKYPSLKIYALEDWPDDLCKFLAERALVGE